MGAVAVDLLADRAAGHAGGGDRVDGDVALERLVRDAVVAGGVAEADLVLLLLDGLVAELLQPDGGARTASGGVHDEVGVQGLLGAVRAAHDDAVDLAPVRRGHQALDGGPLQERDLGQREHPVAHVALEERAAGGEGDQPGVDLGEALAVDDPAHVVGDVTGLGAGRPHLLGDAREVLLGDLLAAGEQAVQVVPLRQAAAQFVRTGQLVAVHDRDVREGLGESTGGEKARHAPAEHYRAAFALSSHSDLLSFDKRSGNNKSRQSEISGTTWPRGIA